MLLKVVAAALLFHAAAAQTSAPGGSIGISQDAISYFTDNLLAPQLKDHIEGIKIPEVKIDKSGVKLHILCMRTEDFNCDDCLSAKFDKGGGGGPEADSGVDITIKDFTLRLHSRFDWQKSILKGGGECDSKLYMKEINTKLHLGMSGGKLALLPSGNVKAEVDRFDLNCHGISGSILNVFQGAFKDHINSAIQEGVQTGVLLAEESIGLAVGNITLEVPINDGFAQLRFDLTSQPNVTDSSATATVLADIVPTNGSSGGTPFPAPLALPSYDAKVGGQFQIYISDYSLNTAVYTFWAGGRLSGTLDKSTAPAPLQKYMNTQAFAPLAPGITTKYKNLPVQLIFDVDPKFAPYVSVSAASKVQATITTRLRVRPVTASGPVEAFNLLCAMQWSGNVGIDVLNSSLVMTANASLDNTTVTVGNSTVGDVNIAAATSTVETIGSAFLVPLINQDLQNFVLLPKLPGFTPTDFSLTILDEFIRVVTSVKATNPPSSRRRRRRKSSRIINK